MKTCVQEASPTSVAVSSVNPLPAWKRALDISVSLAALPFLAPIAMTIALATKCSSPGPVLFKQVRVGYQGNTFLCYKFRTMRVGADVTGHQAHLNQLIHSRAPMVKLDSRGDSRLIPGGRILRASGLDELPQIINILRGEMSLVGPRPCIPYEYQEYSPEQKRRFGSVPGLTGLWQVSGKNKTTFDEMIQYDIAYGKMKSLFLDLKIIVKTPAALAVQLREAATRSRAKTTVLQTTAEAPPVRKREFAQS